MSTQKQLISQLSDTLAEKVISINERGLTSADWTVYNNATKRTRYSTVPSSDIATRPLAIRKDGTWYAYGWDLTKNICEVFGPAGYIRTAYAYAPYGQVEANGDVTQPIQWSSEYLDPETALIYYNYRHYNPVDGRWTGRDRLQEEEAHNLYSYVYNSSTYMYDMKGNSVSTLSSYTLKKVPRRILGRRLGAGEHKLPTFAMVEYICCCRVKISGSYSYTIKMAQELDAYQSAETSYDLVLKHEIDHFNDFKSVWNEYVRLLLEKEGFNLGKCSPIKALLVAKQTEASAKFSYLNKRRDAQDYRGDVKEQAKSELPILRKKYKQAHDRYKKNTKSY